MPLLIGQNRELQIMRIVRHPNIVELKAFFYNNGERVRVGCFFLSHPPNTLLIHPATEG